MTRVQVCAGGIADIESIMSVMDDSFDPAFGEAWTAAQCAGLMPLPGVWLTLARAGGEVVGFALGRIILREAELLLLAVARGQQGKGVGRKLLESFAQEAASRGAEKLHLEVRDGNPAIHLYIRSGFTEVGRRKSYYTGGDGQLFDALTLTRLVAS